jgi:hypothetical protein
MIDSEILCWWTGGIATGWLHSWLLWHATHRISVWMPAMGILRLGMVATALVAAAVAGHIVVMAMGWAIGFVGVGAWFARSELTHRKAWLRIHSQK